MSNFTKLLFNHPLITSLWQDAVSAISLNISGGLKFAASLPQDAVALFKKCNKILSRVPLLDTLASQTRIPKIIIVSLVLPALVAPYLVLIILFTSFPLDICLYIAGSVLELFTNRYIHIIVATLGTYAIPAIASLRAAAAIVKNVQDPRPITESAAGSSSASQDAGLLASSLLIYWVFIGMFNVVERVVLSSFLSERMTAMIQLSGAIALQLRIRKLGHRNTLVRGGVETRAEGEKTEKVD